jgi:hypothetical protein
MRTTSSKVTFRSPFTLNASVGELPAGTYDMEVDEEEIAGVEITGYRRIATLLFVQRGESTRTVACNPVEFDAALKRDAEAAR